jgi:hypothetical protein
MKTDGPPCIVRLFMKAGDLIRKVRGDSDLGETGLIVSVNTNSLGVTILQVVCTEFRHSLVGTSELINKNWLAEFCEIINEPI